jgi:4-amino-4-deoxy-L-arabinose transferase-like glycosyltransferase
VTGSWTLPRPRRTWLLPSAVGIGVIALLLPFVDRDPVGGVTFSNGPFTDEGWWSLNARNLVLLGTWQTDRTALHLVSLPFALGQWAVFSVFGVGIVQARLLSILATAAAAAVLAAGCRRSLGTPAALVAGVAFGTCGLVLYHGRLAYLEPLVTLLVAGSLVAVRATTAGVLLAAAAGTKASALLPGVGLLAAGVVTRSVGWTARAAAVVAAAAAVWILVIALPARDAVGYSIRILNRPTLPDGDLLGHAVAYLRSNDGASALTMPLLIGAVAGLGLGAFRWRTLGPDARQLVLLSVGTLAVGLATLSVIEYRPNRYAMPLVPALAVLAAVGVSVFRRGAVAVASVVCVAMAAPGVVAHAGWMASAGHTLRDVQVAARAADTPVAGGYAATWAMTARQPIVYTWGDDVAAGDLYDAGVRWLVGRPDEAPAWMDTHPDAWRARVPIHCARWGRDDVCLFRLP